MKKVRSKVTLYVHAPDFSDSDVLLNPEILPAVQVRVAHVRAHPFALWGGDQQTTLR